MSNPEIKTSLLHHLHGADERFWAAISVFANAADMFSSAVGALADCRAETPGAGEKALPPEQIEKLSGQLQRAGFALLDLGDARRDALRAIMRAQLALTEIQLHQLPSTTREPHKIAASTPLRTLIEALNIITTRLEKTDTEAEAIAKRVVDIARQYDHDEP